MAKCNRKDVLPGLALEFVIGQKVRVGEMTIQVIETGKLRCKLKFCGPRDIEISRVGGLTREQKQRMEAPDA